MKPKFTSAMAYNFINGMQNRPDDFSMDDGGYTICDRKTGVEYWVANSWLFFGVYRPLSTEGGISCWWRQRRCWNLAKSLMKERGGKARLEILAAQAKGYYP